MQLLKKCSKCKEVKSLASFNKETMRKDGLNTWCKVCCSQWRKDNTVKLQATNKRCRERKLAQYQASSRRYVLSQYGMTPNDFDTLKAIQNNSCAICGVLEPGGKDHKFHIDHNHETLNIRGLLCHHCNKGLGQLKDCVEILEKAITYLKTAKTNFYKKVR